MVAEVVKEEDCLLVAEVEAESLLAEEVEEENLLVVVVVDYFQTEQVGEEVPEVVVEVVDRSLVLEALWEFGLEMLHLAAV